MCFAWLWIIQNTEKYRLQVELRRIFFQKCKFLALFKVCFKKNVFSHNSLLVYLKFVCWNMFKCVLIFPLKWNDCQFCDISSFSSYVTVYLYDRVILAGGPFSRKLHTTVEINLVDYSKLPLFEKGILWLRLGNVT